MKVTYDDLLDRPFPELWWSRRSMPGTTKTRNKHLRLIATTAASFSSKYTMPLLNETAFWGSTGTGDDEVLLTTWAAPFGAVEKHHDALVAGLLPSLPDDDLVKWFTNNHGDARDLLSWHLIETYMETVMGLAAFTSVARDPEPVRVLEHVRSKYAQAFTDAALVMVQTSSGAIEAQLRAMALTTRPPTRPPWK